MATTTTAGSAPATTPAPAARAVAVVVAPLAAGAVALLLGLLLVPRVVNGDGLGYLKAAPTGLVVPGHLGYLPLVRLVGRPTGRATPLGLLGPATALSLAAGVLAAMCVAASARRLYTARFADGGVAAARAGLVAGLGFAASYGALEAAADVEAYAPSLAALSFALWAASARRAGGGRAWLLLVALGEAAAALFHVENVLAAPALALLAAAGSSPPAAAPRDGKRVHLVDALTVLLGSGALVLGAYLAAFHARGDDAASALRWVIGANHGFSYPLRWSSPFVAVYGMAKTLVYAPYPHQASWPRVIGQTAAGTILLGALTWLVARARRPSGPRALDALAFAAWILPYAAVGVAFFASDNERWLFLLPPVWVVAGHAVTAGRGPRLVAAGLVLALMAGDLALGVPLARATWIRDRVDVLSTALRPGDLVVSPGHSWDEYLGFYDAVDVDRFPIIYFCGLLGGREPMQRELARRVADARRRGARVWLARGGEPESSDGWKELVRFGVTPATLDGVLPPARRVAVADGLERLDPVTP